MKLKIYLFYFSDAITETAEIISRIILTENANFREKESKCLNMPNSIPLGAYFNFDN